MRRVLLALVAVSMVSCGLVRAAEVNPLLPKETEQVVYINVKQILESDIIKKYAKSQIEQALESQEVADKIKSLGLDPMKDINQVTLGMWGPQGDEQSAAMVITGKFDADKLFEAAKKEAGSSDTITIEDVKDGDSTFKLVKLVNENGKPFFMSLADEKTIVGSTDKDVTVGALNAFNKKEKAKLEPKLSNLVLKQDEKASMFFCGVVAGKLDEIPGDFSQLQALGVDGDKLKEQLSGMQTMSVTLRLGKEVNLDLSMGMKDVDSADEFAASLDKILDAAKNILPFVAGQQPQLQGVIGDLTKSLKVKSKDSNVALGLAIKAESIADASGGGDR